MAAKRKLPSKWNKTNPLSIARTFPILAPIAVAIPLLNPAQTSYLLWEFQVWWYLDFAMFAAAMCLIERFRFRFYPMIVALCVLATGLEVQGAFLWLSTGVQLFLIATRTEEHEARWKGIVVLIAHVVLFLGVAWLLMKGSNVNIAHAKPALSFLDHVSYIVKMVGGGFGIRSGDFFEAHWNKLQSAVLAQ